MAENSVTTTFFADAKAAEQAIAQLEKKYADLENKIKQVSKRSKQDQQGATEELTSWATKLTAIAAGYVSVSGEIQNALRLQTELNQKADEAATKFDALTRKVRVQAGLTELQGAEAQGKISQAALRAAVPFEVAAGGAEEMISRGFDTGAATGAGLDQMLATIRATNSDPSQVKQQVAAYAQLLSASGLDKNAENLERVTVAVQRVFKGTPLQASDLQALAPKVQGVSGVMSFEEALAQFAIMREKASPDVAATSLKLIYERLQTAEGTKSSEEALGKLGLKAGDVDLVGESSRQVLDRLAAGLEKLPAEQRPGVMKDLFGQEAMAAATGLIRDRSKIQEFMDLQGDRQGFREDVGIAVAGQAAAAERAGVLKEGQMARRDQGFEEALRASELLQRQAGLNEWEISQNVSAARWSRFFGTEAVAAVAANTPGLAVGERELVPTTPEQLQAAMTALRTGQVPNDPEMLRQTELLQAIRDLLAQNEPAGRNIPRRVGPEE